LSAGLTSPSDDNAAACRRVDAAQTAGLSLGRRLVAGSFAEEEQVRGGHRQLAGDRRRLLIVASRALIGRRRRTCRRRRGHVTRRFRATEADSSSRGGRARVDASEVETGVDDGDHRA